MLNFISSSILNPPSVESTKNDGGDGLSDPLKAEIDSIVNSTKGDADAKAVQIAKIIEKEANGLTHDEKKLTLEHKSLTYIRAKDSNLFAKVHEKLTDAKKDNGYIDTIGIEQKLPAIVEEGKNDTAKAAWDGIVSGLAYNHIEGNEESIKNSLGKARGAAGTNKILETDNKALRDLKKELMKNMSAEAADEDISTMLKSKNLLKSGESVKIEIESSSTTSSKDTTKDLEDLKSQLITEINKPGTTPEQVKAILSRSVDKFEKFRPKDNIEPEIFYSEQMQDVLKRSDNYKDYSVAATASLRKEGGLIKTTNKEVFVNRDGKFVNDEGRIYKVVDDEIEVNGKKINIKDIKASEPKISIVMDQDRAKVENKTLELGGLYIEDQKLVHKARGDQYAQDRLDDRKGILDEARAAVKAKRDREGKSGSNDTLTSIIGIVSALATIVAALSGGGRTTSITGGADYNGQNGYGYGSYGQNGGGDPRISDKYGYNRGYQATIDAAYERSNQYLSTMQFNPYLPPGVTHTAVSTRARTMRNAGMNVIQGRPPRV